MFYPNRTQEVENRGDKTTIGEQFGTEGCGQVIVRERTSVNDSVELPTKRKDEIERLVRPLETRVHGKIIRDEILDASGPNT